MKLEQIVKKAIPVTLLALESYVTYKVYKNIQEEHRIYRLKTSAKC